MAASKAVADPSIPVAGYNTFNKLPGEMRNKIWELSFTNNDQVVDLRNPSPLTKSLLLTCKKINSEARGLYQDAYRAYWTTSPFQISIARPGLNGICRWSAALYDKPELKTLMVHERHITDLTIVLACTEKEKVFKCIQESIFLGGNGICTVTVKFMSNIQAHWKDQTECRIYIPYAVPNEVADAWLRKIHDRGETEARVYTYDAFHSVHHHVADMLRHVDLEDVLNSLTRLAQVESLATRAWRWPSSGS